MGGFDITRRRSCSPSWCGGAISISILGIIATMMGLLMVIVILRCDSPSAGTYHIVSAKHTIASRKLLGREEAHRKCRKEDIGIYQIATPPLYNGIPTYRVEIVNECASGCRISQIHLHCEWFSSASLVNPNTFKRIHYNDCLVNDGKPLTFGSTLSFQYANTYSYPLSVSSLRCL